MIKSLPTQFSIPDDWEVLEGGGMGIRLPHRSLEDMGWEILRGEALLSPAPQKGQEDATPKNKLVGVSRYPAAGGDWVSTVMVAEKPFLRIWVNAEGVSPDTVQVERKKSEVVAEWIPVGPKRMLTAGSPGVLAPGHGEWQVAVVSGAVIRLRFTGQAGAGAAFAVEAFDIAAPDWFGR